MWALGKQRSLAEGPLPRVTVFQKSGGIQQGHLTWSSKTQVPSWSLRELQRDGAQRGQGTWPRSRKAGSLGAERRPRGSAQGWGIHVLVQKAMPEITQAGCQTLPFTIIAEPWEQPWLMTAFL